MTDQTPNDAFHASSFLQGANADYVEQLYARFAADPGSVDAAWAAFFHSLGDAELDVKRQAKGASWDRPEGGRQTPALGGWSGVASAGARAGVAQC